VAAPEAVNRVLDHPYVGAWATRTALRSRRGHSSAPADLARVAAAAAIRVRVSTTVWLPPGEVLALPSLRRTSAPSVRTCSESSSSRSAGPDQGVRPAGFARGSATAPADPGFLIGAVGQAELELAGPVRRGDAVARSGRLRCGPPGARVRSGRPGRLQGWLPHSTEGEPAGQGTGLISTARERR
jgi:hypothetical protein